MIGYFAPIFSVQYRLAPIYHFPILVYVAKRPIVYGWYTSAISTLVCTSLFRLFFTLVFPQRLVDDGKQRYKMNERIFENESENLSILQVNLHRYSKAYTYWFDFLRSKKAELWYVFVLLIARLSTGVGDVLENNVK